MRPYQRRRLALGTVLLAIVVTGIALVVVDSDSGAAEDIWFEGKGEVGQDPFTTEALSRCPPGTEPGPAAVAVDQCIGAATSTTASTAASTTASTTSSLGPGTTTSQRVCEPEGLIRFLRQDQAAAAAWVAALDEDPTLRWSEDRDLGVDDVADYLRELTPMFLSEDTRVTNHGLVDGEAVPRQSVLQAGTAVLVDRDGISRTRCAGGSPLIRPHDVDEPRYRGTCWDGCRRQPYCAGSGCAGTTTTAAALSTTSSSAASTSTTKASQQGGPTTTRARPKPATTTTRPKPAATTTTAAATTTAPEPSTTTSSPPDATTTTAAP